VKKAVATCFGVGCLPAAPGTFGSAVGVLFSWLLQRDPVVSLIGLAGVIGLGFWSAGPTARQMGKGDPSCVVIDEVAGMMLALVLLPLRWPVVLAGFLLFRLLDITKPWLIRKAERFPGSAGIMLDDLLAGLAAQLLLRIALILLG